MRKRLLAAAAGVLLMAGCTVPVTPPNSVTPGVTPATGQAGGRSSETVHVKLVIESDQPTIVRYSDGQDTSPRILASPGQVIEFDATTPWAVAGTAVKEAPGYLACHLYVDGQLVSTFDSVEKFARCGASEKRTGDDKPASGTHLLSMKMTSLSGAWVAWTSAYTGGEETSSPGNLTLSTSQAGGHARMVVIADAESDDATCQITVDGFKVAAADTDDVGDIATCSVVAEHPLVDDQLPQPTKS